MKLLHSTTQEPDDYGSDVEVGVDTGEVGSPETIPAADQEHLGISTDQGTNPVDTDQGDEENEARIYDTPDDVSSDAYGDELGPEQYPPSNE